MNVKISAIVLFASILLSASSSKASVVSYGSGYCDTSWNAALNEPCRDGRAHPATSELNDCGSYNSSNSGASIPEAGTYSLAAGVAALGFVLVRRSRSTAVLG